MDNSSTKMLLWQLIGKARTLEIGPLLNKILPLLIQSCLCLYNPTLEDHLMVKFIDRILYTLNEWLSIDEDYYAFIKERERERERERDYFH